MDPAVPPDIPAGESLSFVLEGLTREILSFREQQRLQPVARTGGSVRNPGSSREILRLRNPIDLDRLRLEVGDLLRRWTVHVTHPAYFGLFNPQVDPASNRGRRACRPVQPATRGLVACSGRQRNREAHARAPRISAVAGRSIGNRIVHLRWRRSEPVRRDRRAHSRFPEFGEHGARALSGAPRMYASEESHHSLLKIAHFTGSDERLFRSSDRA